MRPDLRLRPLNDGDEAEALAAHAELAADDFSFLLDHDTARPWAEHVQLHRRIRCGPWQQGRAAVGRSPAMIRFAGALA